uniref:Uncharacterized protein n=1 Tax=Leersia perrieri TaxID=77586 RepID=A0A0D9XZC0_9ORYZ
MVAAQQQLEKKGSKVCSPSNGWLLVTAPKLLCSSSSSSSYSPFPTSMEKLYLMGLVGMETLAPVPNLTELSINNCSGLRGGESPPRWMDKLFADHRLHELRTDDFAGFFAAPICSLLSSSLTMLDLTYNEEVECFTNEQEEALHILTSLQELRFLNCDKFRSLPLGLCHLPSLTNLCIGNCPEIRSLEGLPDSLQKLIIHSLPAITSLGVLPDSLQKLMVDDLPAITSLGILPDSLQELDIDDCRVIRSLDRLPSSLQELRIGNCPTISPLPNDGIPTTL